MEKKDFELQMINNIGPIFDANNATVELICTTIEAFVKNLPFSMDPLSTKFVLATLLHAIPVDRETRGAFKYEIVSLFDNLKEWRDTRKTAYAIELCALLQRLLLDRNFEMPLFDQMKELNVWGLDEENSGIIKKILEVLPLLRNKILSSKTVLERENALMEAYQIIKKSFNIWSPADDLYMYYYFSHLLYKPYNIPHSTANYISSDDNQTLEIPGNHIL